MSVRSQCHKRCVEVSHVGGYYLLWLTSERDIIQDFPQYQLSLKLSSRIHAQVRSHSTLSMIIGASVQKAVSHFYWLCSSYRFWSTPQAQAAADVRPELVRLPLVRDSLGHPERVHGVGQECTPSQQRQRFPGGCPWRRAVRRPSCPGG